MRFPSRLVATLILFRSLAANADDWVAEVVSVKGHPVFKDARLHLVHGVIPKIRLYEGDILRWTSSSDVVVLRYKGHRGLSTLRAGVSVAFSVSGASRAASAKRTFNEQSGNSLIGDSIALRQDRTPYYSNDRWDNGEWSMDGSILGFHFGSAKIVPLSVEEPDGLRLHIPLNYGGDLNLGYLWLDGDNPAAGEMWPGRPIGVKTWPDYDDSWTATSYGGERADGWPLLLIPYIKSRGLFLNPATSTTRSTGVAAQPFGVTLAESFVGYLPETARDAYMKVADDMPISELGGMNSVLASLDPEMAGLVVNALLSINHAEKMGARRPTPGLSDNMVLALYVSNQSPDTAAKFRADWKKLDDVQRTSLCQLCRDAYFGGMNDQP